MNDKLKWTGERLVTQISNEDTIYHLHRYSIPQEYIKDKTVVDVASGEGYGSNIMATTAYKVIGIDISKEAVTFANQKYGHRSNLRFIEGSADKIPLEDGIADVVVSFETLEHIDTHQEMMLEIKRILKPGGILIISSPDKANYSDRFNRVNEFHVKELYMEEFKTLLAQHFKHCIFYYQTFLTGSFIFKEDYSGTQIKEYNGNYNQIQSSDNLSFPMFNIAIASDASFTPQENSYFEGTDTMREFYYNTVMGFTPYKLGNAILKPLRRLFKR
ncbi:class I SAM-dependent methyltransferase [Paradesertivirga mongoliensis]|uniref:Class I SAM-dependent methyltransferase n=1 Tax=Paradesertivirga mongoliensis TaxID=2100740 RepID=A0ABW4ZG78_9SPHI|nr:class I SAM-dependent methyltransferase [Pedobacter mongoliensis]